MTEALEERTSSIDNGIQDIENGLENLDAEGTLNEVLETLDEFYTDSKSTYEKAEEHAAEGIDDSFNTDVGINDLGPQENSVVYRTTTTEKVNEEGEFEEVEEEHTLTVEGETVDEFLNSAINQATEIRSEREAAQKNIARGRNTENVKEQEFSEQADAATDQDAEIATESELAASEELNDASDYSDNMVGTQRGRLREAVLQERSLESHVAKEVEQYVETAYSAATNLVGAENKEPGTFADEWARYEDLTESISAFADETLDDPQTISAKSALAEPVFEAADDAVDEYGELFVEHLDTLESIHMNMKKAIETAEEVYEEDEPEQLERARGYVNELEAGIYRVQSELVDDGDINSLEEAFEYRKGDAFSTRGLSEELEVPSNDMKRA
jgi:hypothetical protein